MLMDYLAQNPLTAGERVMELGCGWGLLGIYCAKHFPVDVMLVDADPLVFPFVEAHIRLNAVQVRTHEVTFDRLADQTLREHDVLLGADICFWPELATQLRRLIARALSQGVRRILLADPGRISFLRLAEEFEHRHEGRLISWKAHRKVGTRGYLLVIDR
ncbi:hypothetical protein D779_0135 [Imhoffiella purpurea]|uniref:Methyltransferase n=2 Tax=Imhoffiella purpurea TaxID=1249627 RepID=W9VAR3_9GAMM|nr:hypothetical protein D779_0135 [Imhoffiella purpurea]